MTIRPSSTGLAGLAALLFTTAVTAACQGPAPAPSPAPAPAAIDPAEAAREKLIARAKSFELPTPYEPPPGDALSHHTAGYVKTVCSAVFLTGYTAEFAAEHVGYFTGPYEHRAKVGKPVVDMAKKTVSITLPSGVVRTAVFTNGQGCITYPEGASHAELHAEAGEAEPAGGRVAGLADGRPPVEGAVPGRHRRSEGQGRRRGSLRIGRRPKRRRSS